MNKDLNDCIYSFKYEITDKKIHLVQLNEYNSKDLTLLFVTNYDILHKLAIIEIEKILMSYQILIFRNIIPLQPFYIIEQQKQSKVLQIESNFCNHLSHPYKVNCILGFSPTNLLETLLHYIMLQKNKNIFSKKSSVDTCESDKRSQFSSIRIKTNRSGINQYQIKETIGLGGFGTVKKAIHKPTGELVAVKICTIQSDANLAQSIQEEIQHQRSLVHQNIAQIYQVIQHQGKIYVFMEYCKNGELFQRINKNGPLSEKDAAKVFHQILSALLYLKANNLSHRDIKPQNILFDEQWNAKLIDFGFSCRTSEINGFRKTVCGTPSYTSPEIIKRKAYDPEKVDVWSLGVTLYAMLVAQLPFQAQDPQERKKNIVSFKYTLEPSLSSKAQRLFASIFVDAKYRPHLSDLKNCEFLLSYNFSNPQYIDFKLENPQLEQKVLMTIQKYHKADINKVVSSVKACRLDKYHALYYLTLKNIKSNNKSLSLYRKQRNSLTKLIPICKTPPLSKHHQCGEEILLLKTQGLRSHELSRFRPRLIGDSKIRQRSKFESSNCLIDCFSINKQF